MFGMVNDVPLGNEGNTKPDPRLLLRNLGKMG